MAYPRRELLLALAWLDMIRTTAARLHLSQDGQSLACLLSRDGLKDCWVSKLAQMVTSCEQAIGCRERDRCHMGQNMCSSRMSWWVVATLGMQPVKRTVPLAEDT